MIWQAPLRPSGREDCHQRVEIGGTASRLLGAILDVVLDGRLDLTPMLTHLRALSDWRDAFDLLADQAASGAVKVAFDQR